MSKNQSLKTIQQKMNKVIKEFNDILKPFNFLIYQIERKDLRYETKPALQKGYFKFSVSYKFSLTNENHSSVRVVFGYNNQQRTWAVNTVQDIKRIICEQVMLIVKEFYIDADISQETFKEILNLLERRFLNG